MMDCIHSRVLIVLQGRDVHELDADSRAALDAHLEQCADCLAWSHQESRVDDALGQAIRAVPVPAALPSKILHALEHQRRPWRVPRLAVAASLLLLALGAGGYFWMTQRTDLGFATLDQDAGYVVLNSPTLVEESFAEQGMPLAAPRQLNGEQLNYDLYNWSGFVSIKGRRVPRIDFFTRGDADTPGAVAHVYVVPLDRFDVQELIEAVPSPTPTNNHTVEVSRPGDQADCVYIFVYTGGSMRPFLLRTPGV